MSIESAADNLEAQFRRIAQSYMPLLRDPRVFAEKINRQIRDEGFMSQIVDKRFETEGMSSGAPWKSLKPKTIEQRMRLGYGPGPILQRSTALRMAATGGPQTVTADSITMELMPAPAPIYKGRGQHRFKRLSKKKIKAATTVAAMFGALPRIGAIQDYAAALNWVRPFYGPVSAEEAAPVEARRDELVEETFQAMMEGRSLSEVFG